MSELGKLVAKFVEDIERLGGRVIVHPTHDQGITVDIPTEHQEEAKRLFAVLELECQHIKGLAS